MDTTQTADRSGDIMATWNDVIKRLADRRARFQAEIERIDGLMRAVRELQEIVPDAAVPENIDRLTQDAPAQMQPVAQDNAGTLAEPVGEEVPTERKRERNVLPPADIAAFARETLLAEGRPMKRGELVRAIEARGLPLAGRDKAKNLGTILWRHRRQFESLEGLGYWPSDVPLQGVYTPDE